MHTDSRLASPSTTTTATAAHRRRRHLSVYRRALQTANTPAQRAAVAARYRHLFTMDSAPAATLTLAPEPAVSSVSTGSVVPAHAAAAVSSVSTGSVVPAHAAAAVSSVSTGSVVPAHAAAAVSSVSTGSVEKFTVTVAA